MTINQALTVAKNPKLYNRQMRRAAQTKLRKYRVRPTHQQTEDAYYALCKRQDDERGDRPAGSTGGGVE